MENKKLYTQLYKETLGKYIKERRDEKDYTQEKVAEMANLHEKHISRVEKGVQESLITTVYLICRALELDLGTLTNKVHDEVMRKIRDTH